MKKKLLRSLFLFGLIWLSYAGMSQTAPFTESFNTTSIPTGWTNTSSSSSTNAQWKFSGTPGNPSMAGSAYNPPVILDHTGNNGSIAWSDGSSPAVADCGLMTDSIDISALTSLYLEFWYYSNNVTNAGDNNTLYVNFYDGTQWNDSIWGYAGDGTVWQYAGIDLSSYTTSGKVMFEFILDQTTSNTAFYNDVLLDDISVKNAPACPLPLNLASSNITATSATLSWSSVTAATGYNVLVDTVGFDPSTATAQTTTVDSINVTNLMAATNYEFYVVANCGANGYSDTTGPVSFQTACVTYSMPFSEDFTTWPPTCFDITNTGALIWDHNSAGHAQARFWSFSSGTANLTTPPIDITQVARLKFKWAHLYSSSYPFDQMIVRAQVVGTSTWDTLADFIGPVDFNTPASNNTSPPASLADFASEIIYLDSATYFGQEIVVDFVAITDFGPNLYVDDVVIEAVPACPEPTQIVASNFTSSTADVSWSSSGSKFILEYGPCGFNQGTGTFDTVYTNSATLTGLFANTSYEVYIQTDCSAGGNGISVWSLSPCFRTTCNPFAEGYSQNFDGTTSGDLDPCWSELALGGVHNVYSFTPFAFSQVQPVSAPNLLYWYNSGSAWSGVITPEFTGLDGDTTQIRFKMTNNYFSSTTNINVWVGTMSDRSDTSTIAWVDTILTTNRNWADYTILLDNVPAGHKFVVFARDNSVTFSEVDIEDFYFEGIPQCLPPTSGMGQATSSSSISVSWVGPGTSYDVEYGVQGFTQGTGSIDTNVTSPYGISNLAPNTCYDVYVRTNCGAGSTSPWFGPITVCTPCNPSSMPYSEDFATWPPACFSFDNTTNWDWDQDPAGHARARFWSFNGGTAFMTSGPVSISQKARVKFSWAHLYSSFYPNDRLVFLARVQGSPVWDTLVNLNGPTFTSPNATNTQPPALTDFVEEKFNLDSATYNGNVAEFMFAATSGFGPNLFVDDFIVEAQPTCTEPDQVSVSNITGFTADLNWNSSVGSLFEIEYGPQGFTPGTGTAIVDTTASMPYTFMGLTPVTCYDVYIRTLCGTNGNSIWTGPIPFCTAVSCPAPTNIQLVSAGQTTATLSWTTGSASNWNYVNVAQGLGPGQGTIMFNATNPQTVTGLTSGTGYSFFVRDSCGPGDVSAWEGPFDYVTPLCDTAQQCDYTVYMHDSYGDGWNGYEFGLAVSGTTLETFGETFVSSGGFPPTDFEDTAYISACNGFPTDVVIHQSGGFANEVSFEIVSSSGDTVFALAQGSLGSTSPLGSFTPNCIPISCPIPDSLMAMNVTATSADLSWNSPSNGNNFQVSWGQMPFNPGGGTIVGSTTTSYNLTSLSSNTNYGYYVREICGVGDTSLWNGPYTFSTLCATFTAPFYEDFETATGTSGCWSQAYGVGTNDWSFGTGSTGGAVVTANSGTMNAVHTSSPGTQSTYLISPLIDASGTSNPVLAFAYAQEVWFGDQNSLTVYYRDSPGGAWNYLWADSSSVAAWTIDSVSVPSSSATLQFGFLATDNYGRGVVLDDVFFGDLSTCPDPTNVAVTNKTCTTLEVSWNSDGGTVMSGVLYGPAGFNPGTGGGTMIMPATSPQTISSLMVGTSYDIYVVDSCSLGLSSFIKVTDSTANGPLPVASFTANPNAGTHPDTVQYGFSALPSSNADSYWWDYGDGSANDTDAFTVHDFTMNGTYTVTLVVTNECGSDTATQQIVIEGIDIEESLLGRSLNIYPNPTAGQFKVEFDVDGRQEITVRVMDALGRVIDNRELGFVTGPQELTIDLSGNASGIYLIQIDSKDGSITKRVTLRNR